MVTDNSTESDDMMQDAWSLGECEGHVLFLLNGIAIETEKLLEILNRQHWDQFRSPSDMCARYSMQACGSCDRVECGDNTSPAKKRIRELEKEVRAQYVKGLKAGLTRFAWWKDGEQQVGSCGTTLKKAMEDADKEHGKDGS